MTEARRSRHPLAWLREARWLRRTRVIRWSLALLVAQTVVLAMIVLWEFGVFGPSRSPFVSDFPSFYAAGDLALQGLSELAYDENAHWFAEQALGDANTPYTYFFYPPPYLLLCAALASMPYWVAYAAFECVPLVAYVLLARKVAALGGWGWCIPALAFPAVFWCVGLGQNAFVTATLLAAGILFLETSPRRSGVLFGLLCIKPHFALLVPVALVAGRFWRALLAMVLTTALVSGATVWLFGIVTWLAYLETMAGAGEVYGSGTILLAGYVTPFGAARLVGLSLGTALALQGLISIFVMMIVGWLWRSGAPQPIRAAALLAGTVLSVPVAIFYDLMPISFCIAWLVRAGTSTGFLPWEKSMLTLTYALSFATIFIGWMVRVPLGVFAPAIVLALCLLRARLPTQSGTRNR